MSTAPDLEPPPFGAPFLDLFVMGDPVTQGSLTHGNGNTYNDHWEDLMWWRQRIELAVRRHNRDKVCAIGPVVATLVFHTARPLSAPRWRKYPTERASSRNGRRYGADIEKAERALYDGLATTKSHVRTGKNKGAKVERGAGVMADDAQVIAHQAHKIMAPPGDDTTGVRVLLWELPAWAEREGWTPVAVWPSWRYERYETVVGF